MKTKINSRYIIAAIGVPLLIPVFIFSDTFILPVVIALFSVMAMYELLVASRLLKKWLFTAVTVLYSISCPLVARWWSGIDSVAIVTAIYILFAVSYSVISENTEILNRFYSTVFLITYASIGLASLVVIRDTRGTIMLVVTFAIAWLTDSFAFFAGSAFGKHKLIPRISPHKTVEGSVGGTLLTVIVCLIVYVGIGIFSKSTPNYLPLVFLTLFASLMAQVGDLVFSQIKRYYKVKDFSTLLAEHGGILDRFDSMISAALTVVIFTAVFSYVRLF